MDGVRVAVGSLWHNLFFLFFYLKKKIPLLCFSSRPCSFCMNVNETKDKELLKNDNFIVSVGGVLECPFFKWGVGCLGGWWVGDFLWWQFLIRKYFKKNDSGVFFRPFSKQKKG